MVRKYAGLVRRWMRTDRGNHRLGIEHMQSYARTVMAPAPVVFWLVVEMEFQIVATGNEFRFMDGTAHFC